MHFVDGWSHEGYDEFTGLLDPNLVHFFTYIYDKPAVIFIYV